MKGHGQGHFGPAGRAVRACSVAVARAVALGARRCILGPVASSASAACTCSSDEQGANDEPGQKDLTRHGIDVGGLPTTIGVTWNWDTTGFSGSNTGDACAL